MQSLVRPAHQSSDRELRSRSHGIASTQYHPTSSGQPLRATATLFLLITVAFCSGCVALNIPSERLYDADDDGGWLGGWNKPKRLGVSEGAVSRFVAGGEHSGSIPFETGFTDSAPVFDEPSFGQVAYGNPDEACFGEEFDPESEAEPDVPWPRFHPIPTRPVFGGPPVLGG